MAQHAEFPERFSREALDTLLESRGRFLSFIQSRVESREVAEDILQAAFVKAIEKVGTVRDEETIVAWFYRILRNAIIDHYRKRGFRERASEALVQELETHIEPRDSWKGCQRRLKIPQFPPVENSPVAPVEKSPGAERL